MSPECSLPSIISSKLLLKFVLFMIAVSEKICEVCKRTPFTYENIGHDMSVKTKKLFQVCIKWHIRSTF